MHFGLTEEQKLLQETVRNFVAGECPPQAVRAVFDAGGSHDPALWKGLAELGVAGIAVPEAYGGAGLELLDLALVAEELGAGAVPAPFLGHAMACVAIALGGSEEQRERWLPGLAAGEVLGTVAYSEPGGGLDPGALATECREGALFGAKSLVPNASAADLLVVAGAGGRLFAVERGAPGLRLEPVSNIDRTRPLESVRLEGAPAEELERPVADRVRDAGLVLLAADAFGCGHRLVRMSAEYAKTRQQFGRPIAEFQAVKHQLADMAVEIDPSRGLWWFAAHAFDHLPEERERAAALAKAHITDRAMQVARSAVETHGGLGFTWECDVQIYFKRAAFDRVVLGTPDQHRDRIADLGGY